MVGVGFSVACHRQGICCAVREGVACCFRCRAVGPGCGVKAFVEEGATAVVGAGFGAFRIAARTSCSVGRRGCGEVRIASGTSYLHLEMTAFPSAFVKK